MIKCIHQIAPHIGMADAVGNQIRECQRLLHGWGYDSKTYSVSWEPGVEGQIHSLDAFEPGRPDTAVILHYAVCSPANDFAFDLPDPLVLYYHNVTPPEFYHRYEPAFADCLARARSGLARFAGRGPAIAASPHNESELRARGFEVLAQAPYVLWLDPLRAGTATPKAQELRQRFDDERLTTWVYVGRMAPNKRIEDIITAFHVYRRDYNRKSRLLLVGNDQGLPSYGRLLHALVRELELDDAVTFTGAYGPSQGLAVFYEMADLYISLSEHEGFCVPLIEAMSFGVPVLAFASTNVPGTLGHSGVLLRDKRPSVVAAAAHEILADPDLRRAIVARQRLRAADFAPEPVREQFHAAVRQIEAYFARAGRGGA